MTAAAIRPRPSPSVPSRTSTAVAPTAIPIFTVRTTRQVQHSCDRKGALANMRKSSELALLVVSAVLLFPAGTFSQDKDTDHGSVDFGVRFATGDVYGRPDLPFQPSLKTSQFNEYQDVRDGFYVRRLDVKFDNVLHTKDYFALQSQSTLYRDQSYLATFGQYGKFKFQFRYDEIPHVFSNTTRTFFVQTAPGVWSFPAAIRSTLQASASSNLPSLIAGTGTNAQQGVVTDFNFITPSLMRKAGTISASYDLTPNLNLNGMYWRESQNGTRPIGLIMNSSPSASATSGFGVELPETISYFNNLVRVGADYGKRDWGVEAAYVG